MSFPKNILFAHNLIDISTSKRFFGLRYGDVVDTRLLFLEGNQYSLPDAIRQQERLPSNQVSEKAKTALVLRNNLIQNWASNLDSTRNQIEIVITKSSSFDICSKIEEYSSVNIQVVLILINTEFPCTNEFNSFIYWFEELPQAFEDLQTIFDRSVRGCEEVQYYFVCMLVI